MKPRKCGACNGTGLLKPRSGFWFTAHRVTQCPACGGKGTRS